MCSSDLDAGEGKLRDPRSGGPQSVKLPGATADHRDVAIGDRSESGEGATDLALAIEGRQERRRGARGQVQGKVRHEAEVYGPPGLALAFVAGSLAR